MNKTAKIILIIVGSLITLCLLAAVAGFVLFRSAGSVLSRTLQTSPDKVQNVASTIADYTLPDGFGSPNAFRLAGFSMLTYTHTDGHSHVTFLQIPQGIHLDPAEMERQYRQSDSYKNHSGENKIRLVDQLDGTIDGQPVTLLISEGTNSDGQPFREVSSIFQGSSGQTMVIYEAPISRWDQDEVDAFLASIH